MSDSTCAVNPAPIPDAARDRLEAIARNAQAVIDGRLPAEPTVAAILRMAAVAADAIEDC